jgi:hypothetical protein
VLLYLLQWNIVLWILPICFQLPTSGLFRPKTYTNRGYTRRVVRKQVSFGQSFITFPRKYLLLHTHFYTTMFLETWLLPWRLIVMFAHTKILYFCTCIQIELNCSHMHFLWFQTRISSTIISSRKPHPTDPLVCNNYVFPSARMHCVRLYIQLYLQLYKQTMVSSTYYFSNS